MTRRRRRLLMSGTATLLLAAGWLAWLNACAGPLRVDPLERRSGEPVVDSQLDLARTYAPWIFHEVHPRGGRQDLPAPLDFDGNLNGDDNWESMPHCELVPTLAYAHLETATHHFLTYHLFHPRDWEPFDLGLHMTHEGDGENLQVVVDKASGRVVLLFTQAHYRGLAWADPEDGFAAGERPLGGPILRIGDGGRPDPRGTHAAVFVEAKGHGILGALAEGARVAVAADGTARFERHGLSFRPALPGDPVREPDLDARAPVPYQLESIRAKLWPSFLRGELVGPGRLLDGPWRYSDAHVEIELPRFHRGARWSGPLGPSRGISCFAVDFGWSRATLGALFFDPARRYMEVLRVPHPWSLEYEDHPFATK